MRLAAVLDQGDAEDVVNLLRTQMKLDTRERRCIVGDFTLDKRAPDAPNVVFVGTGTGLAPVRIASAR